MIDRRWVRNIEWSDWSLIEDFELGGALVLVVSYYKEPTELSLAVAQPLHGWGVRVRMRGRTDRNIDLIADWGTRLTAP